MNLIASKYTPTSREKNPANLSYCIYTNEQTNVLKNKGITPLGRSGPCLTFIAQYKIFCYLV